MCYNKMLCVAMCVFARTMFAKVNVWVDALIRTCIAISPLHTGVAALLSCTQQLCRWEELAQSL